MNGRFSAEATTGKTVITAAETPFFDAAERVKLVYLAVLSRPPEDWEAELWRPQVDTPDTDQRRGALGDLFWVLVNSTEFGVNQ